MAGRNFTDRDVENSTKVVIVNETTARKLWPGQSPLWQAHHHLARRKFPREIVGVVGETKASLDNEPGEQMYVPYAQDASWGSMSFVVRTNGDPRCRRGSQKRNSIAR